MEISTPQDYNHNHAKKFQDLKLKSRYSSMDNKLMEFFIPVLANSKYYFRASGYFSSTVLSASAEGLAHFLKHGEKMYLITGVILSENDYDAIKNGEKEPPEFFEKVLFDELNKMFLDENTIIKSRFQVLAYLVSKKKLEIRIVLPYENGFIDKNCIWHSKFAIFEDHFGNKLQIEGSANETEEGWRRNRESFSVHSDWIENTKEYVISTEQEFWQTWNNENPVARAFNVPQVVMDWIEKRAPPTIKEIIVEPEPKIEVIKNNNLPIPKLRTHQEEAIKKWNENGRKGILSMATGSGKTITAIEAFRRVEGNNFIIILAPSKDLIKQWKDNIKNYMEIPIMECSGNTKWKDTLPDFIRAYKQVQSKKIIISTINTARDDHFINVIDSELGNAFVLVVDEVHRIGAVKSRVILDKINPIHGRLGLSATPSRMWDEEGTKSIERYFDGIIFEYPLKQAIIDGWIVPYDYYTEFVTLTLEERDSYREINQKIWNLRNVIVKEYNLPKGASIRSIMANKNIKQAAQLGNYLTQRANIIKDAEEKIPKVIDIIRNNKAMLGKCLIYCHDLEQLNRLAVLMNKKGYSSITYTGEDPQSIRETSLRLLNEGKVQFIIAVKCLDEGIDIPTVDSAIILASTTNELEFVQRRGRVLRRADGKSHANVFDIFVVPYGIENNFQISRMDVEVLLRELNRALIFLEDANNKDNAINNLIKVQQLINKGAVEDASL